MGTKVKAPRQSAASESNGAKPSRTRPAKLLPTDRIGFAKQLDLLRAFATASGPSGRVVNNNDIAVIVGLKASTISLANPFFVDAGLLQRVEGGFVPSQSVVNFQRAYDWNRDTAALKLAPVISQAWFAEAVMPTVNFGPTDVAQVVARLAEAAAAGPEYRPQLATLVDYLEAAGLVLREGDLVRATTQLRLSVQEDPPSGVSPGTEARVQASLAAPTRPMTASAFSQPTEGVVNFHVSVRVDMKEFAGWSADRITAFFAGVAQVLAAKGRIEQEGLSEE